MLTLLLLAFGGSVVAATPASAATTLDAAPRIFSTEVEQDIIRVYTEVHLKSTKPVLQVRFYLFNTKNGDKKTIYGYEYTEGWWRGATSFPGHRNSTWRLSKVRVLGAGYKSIGSFDISKNKAGVLGVYNNGTYAVAANARVVSPLGTPQARVAARAFVAGQTLDGAEFTLTGTFRRASGSTFTRTATDVYSIGGVSNVFGPYETLRQVSGLVIDNEIPGGGQVGFTF